MNVVAASLTARASFRSSRFERGVTLLELVLAVGVGILLISLIAPISDVFMKRAKKVRCISNMRNIHAGLLGYVSDKGRWPQMEEERFDFTEEEFFKFWIVETEPYGLNPDTWICPMDRSYERLESSDKSEYYGSYVITRFDKRSGTPFRWNQPWAIERGAFHGKGSHILMPDGSVSDSQNPFSGR